MPQSATVLDAVQAIIDEGNTDRASLRQVNWELAPFTARPGH
jgi:hypothetical protein